MVLAHAGCGIACGQEDAHTSSGMMSWPALRCPQQKAWKQTEAWGPGQSGGGSNASSQFGEQFSSVPWSGGRTNCRTQCFPRCLGAYYLFVRRTHREPTFPSRKCCRSTQVKRSIEVKWFELLPMDDSQARADVGQIQGQKCHLCAAWEYAQTYL